MYNANLPPKSELPSTKKLVLSTFVAIVLSTAILFTIVLPAEFGIDYTGLGRVLGLTTMGEIKTSLATEKSNEKTDTALRELPVVTEQPTSSTENLPSEPLHVIRNDTLSLTLQPNEGKEIKVTLSEKENVSFVWSTDGEKVNFDMHADSEELGIDYHCYEKGSDVRREGTLEAAFNGHHGWFWRNRSDKVVTVTLRTSGAYSEINELK